VFVGKPGIFSCYSLACAIQPEKYSPGSAELPRLWNLFRHNLFPQPQPIFRRHLSWPRGIGSPDFSLNARFLLAPRLLPYARSSSFPLRRELSPIQSPSFRHGLQTTHRRCVQKSSRRSALANKILRSHSARARRIGIRCLLHLGEPGSQRPLRGYSRVPSVRLTNARLEKTLRAFE